MAKAESAPAKAAPAPTGGNGKLTHYHDVERLHNLGKLTPEEVAGYREKGLLPPLPGEIGANTMVLEPEAKA
jgi:hypothetical protein